MPLKVSGVNRFNGRYSSDLSGLCSDELCPLDGEMFKASIRWRAFLDVFVSKWSGALTIRGSLIIVLAWKGLVKVWRW